MVRDAKNICTSIINDDVTAMSSDIGKFCIFATVLHSVPRLYRGRTKRFYAKSKDKNIDYFC